MHYKTYKKLADEDYCLLKCSYIPFSTYNIHFDLKLIVPTF